MRKFNHLNVPNQWQHYWSKYPEGYTILEALLNWVAQVDSMTDNINTWNEYLENFVETFDERLAPTVREMLAEMEADGRLADIINQEIFGELNDQISQKSQVQTTSLVVNIPTDYPTLQAAIDELSKRTVPQGISITLLIASGHRPASGITVSNGDYGHFIVSSVDSTVLTGINFTGRFISCVNGIAPVLDCFVDGVNILDRIYSLFNSIGEVRPNKGGKNTKGRPLYANVSMIYAANTIWENCADQIYASSGASIQMGNAIIRGFTLTGNGSLVASRGGCIEAQGILIENCAVGIECKRAGSRINCHGATFSSLTSIAILASRGAVVSCEGSTFTNILKDCFRSNGGSIIADLCTITASAANTGSGAIINGGFSSFNSAIFSGFNGDGIIAGEAASVSARNAKIGVSGRHGIFADTGANIGFVGGESKNNVGNDLRISRGSSISANGSTTTNGLKQRPDTNIVAGFNIPDGDKGILWN